MEPAQYRRRARSVHRGGQTDTFPFEKWHYRYIEGAGENVDFEFMDLTMSGDYRMTLYPADKAGLRESAAPGLRMLESRGLASAPSRFTRGDGTYVIGPTKRPTVRFKDLEAVVQSKIAYNQLPFETRADFVKLTRATALVTVTIQIDGAQHPALNVFGRVSTMTRRVVQTFEDTLAVDTPASLYRQILPLRPGLYRLSVAVKDTASGKMGTIERALRVPAFDDETLASSSLTLTGSSFSMQIYNLGTSESTHQPSAVIEYTVRKAGDPVSGQPVLKMSEKADNAHAPQTTVQKTLPIGSLPAGRYTLQVKVMDNVTHQSIAPALPFTVQ